MKKGGGLALLIRDSLHSFQHHPLHSDPDGDHHMNTEILWVVVQGKQCHLAIGLVYLPSGADPLQWGASLHDALKSDIAEVHNLGYKCMLMGDFNAHVTLDPLGDLTGLNTNGHFLSNIHNDGLLTVLNFHPKCTGTYTWTRATQATTVDYILTDPTLTPFLDHLTIDELQEKWTIGADHCMIEIQPQWPTKRKVPHLQRFLPRWSLSHDTDWSTYRTQLSATLQPWLHTYSDKSDDHDPLQAYAELVYTITMIADKCPPHFHPHRHKKPRCRPLSKQVLRRNSLGKQWRAATLRNNPSAQARWERYKVASRKVRFERTKLLRCQKRNWQRKVLKEGSSSSKTLWKSLIAPSTPLQQ